MCCHFNHVVTFAFLTSNKFVASIFFVQDDLIKKQGELEFFFSSEEHNLQTVGFFLRKEQNQRVPKNFINMKTRVLLLFLLLSNHLGFAFINLTTNFGYFFTDYFSSRNFCKSQINVTHTGRGFCFFFYLGWVFFNWINIVFSCTWLKIEL